MTLAPAYAAAPRHPGRFVMYLTRRGDDATACMVVVFAAAYAARKFLDALLRDDGYVWDDDRTIRSETGIVITTRFNDRMREIVDHRYTAEERAFELSWQHLEHARLFRHGPDVQVAADGAVREVRRAPRPAPVPRASRDGLVTVAEIAATLGVEPREARQALRALKVQKPAAGWAWLAAEVPEVTERIRRGLS